jgi:hypothetical protein
MAAQRTRHGQVPPTGPGSLRPRPSAILAGMLRRRPDLPADRHDAWWAFLDCAEVIEGGRRVLLGTLPTGRVEPAPIAIGTDAVRRSIVDARTWMPAWRLEELEADWHECGAALDEAERALAEVDQVAGSTNELEELLTAVQDVIEPLDAFADAEREWRRRWKLPRER